MSSFRLNVFYFDGYGQWLYQESVHYQGYPGSYLVSFNVENHMKALNHLNRVGSYL